MAELFRSMNRWLLSRALENRDLSETVQLLADRLVDGGIPICRILVGRGMLHPVFGFYDLTWESKTNRVEASVIHRTAVDIDTMKNTPLGQLLTGNADQIRADLMRREEVERFQIFRELASDGVTDYATWVKSFPDDTADLVGWPGFRPCVSVVICTKRFGGFHKGEIEGFETILTALYLCVRISTERFLARELLETYLGRKTGNLVLTGQSSRGDGSTIDCVVFYSDMQGSSRLSEQLDQGEYLAEINRYFDCVAGAVIDHGGEVLKFIGDGVLAIFPISASRRPASAMCTAALSAAREAIARATRLDKPPKFGVGLHVGQVIYGNVGVAERLDYTATGSAVALAARCEELTRKLDVDVVATSEFAALCSNAGSPVGTHEVRGFDSPIDLVGYSAN